MARSRVFNIESRRRNLAAWLRAVVCTGIFVAAGCSATLRVEDGINANGTHYVELPVQMDGIKSPQLRPGQNAELAVAVAISGGGSRAANFGVGVLLGLEELTLPTEHGRTALAEVDYLSTVSGGGFAAGTYVGSLVDYIGQAGSQDGYSLRKVVGSTDAPDDQCEKLRPYRAGQRFSPCTRWQLEHSYEQDIERVLNPFSATTWKIWNSSLTYTDLLERAVDNRLLGAQWRCQNPQPDCEAVERKSLRLKDLFVPQTSPNPVRVPIWVTNATAYGDGTIFPFTPGHLQRYRIDRYIHQLHEYRFPPGTGFDSPEYLLWLYDLPLSVGVTASANFPVALPAMVMGSAVDPLNPHLFLLDGGMADNLGIYTAIRLLRDEPRPGVTRRVLIVIDAYKDSLGPFTVHQTGPDYAEALNRTSTAGLDSWRARAIEMTTAIAKGSGIDSVIYLRFEDLNEDAEVDKLLKLDATGLEALRLSSGDVERLKADLSSAEKKANLDIAASGSPLSLPFRLLRNVPTSFTVTGREQRLLIAAGRRAVQKKAGEIRRAMTVQTPQR